ncbi:MAG: hypothetical protein BGO80_06505 [Devosia sp. 63-57]|nr:MAG: hypothetical protein ABS74_03545 [Pelagibacterium sp. SCN 63-126]OJX45455.1 MAG: hypothetical protein BGO80_06505 [Devosia sp. 63-57]
MLPAEEQGVTEANLTELRAGLLACRQMSRTGRSTEGLIEAQRLLVVARKLGDPGLTAACLTHIGWFCLQLGYADEGLASASEAKALYFETDNHDGQAFATAVYSWLLVELGLSDLGFTEADAAVQMARHTALPALLSFVFGCKGMALMMCRQDQLAYPLLEEALALAEKGDDPSTTAMTLVNMGFSVVSQAEFAEAAGHVEDGLRLRRKAMMFNDRAIDTARACGDLWNLRIALCNGAELAQGLGYREMARAFLDEWDSLPGTVGPRSRIHYLYTRGELLTAWGQLDEALAVCKEAVRLAANGANLDHRVNTLRRLSDVEAALGNHQGALEHYRAFHEAFVYQMGESTRRRAQVTEMQLENERLRLRADRLEEEASKDALTGIFNRRAFESHFERIQGEVFSFAILDIDHFKSVNDRFSHMTGDAVLQRLAGVLGAWGDPVSAYRLGGEEFALIVAGRGQVEAMPIMEAIRVALEQTLWSDLAPGLAITVSIGLVDSVQFAGRSVISEADRRLYAAKTQGRNRVVGGFDTEPVSLRA